MCMQGRNAPRWCAGALRADGHTSLGNGQVQRHGRSQSRTECLGEGLCCRLGHFVLHGEYGRNAPLYQIRCRAKEAILCLAPGPRT